ncbi:MAG TPA: alpha/beta hydrolase family protein [Vicinamibacterales bacterium]|jgi:dienelactone hydrolase
MFARFFYAWERRLHSRTPDRVVRPFEWGLDWVSANGHAPGTPEDVVLAEWAAAALADSQAFFAAPPTEEYHWEPDPTQADGCPGTVMFPSVITTPHAENNIVYGRLFPAPRLKGGRADRRRAVVVLPQWNADAGGHVGLCRLLARFGINAVRLSLPYHDRRMPPSLHRADFIVSANVARTVQVCRQAVVDARRTVAWLAREGYERIGILGTSLGSCLAMLTSAHEPLIRAEALNHVSRYFADVVWEGLSTEHVRAGLEGRITLDRLRELWMPISPHAYVDRVGDKRTLLVYAKYDTTFPVHLSIELIREFDRLRIPYELAVLPCGHYTTGLAPFKYLDGYVLTKFLVRNL